MVSLNMVFGCMIRFVMLFFHGVLFDIEDFVTMKFEIRPFCLGANYENKESYKRWYFGISP